MYQKDILLFSCGQDSTIRVWSLIKSKQIALLENHTSQVTDIDFIMNDNASIKFVSVGRDKIISYYDMKTMKIISTIPIYEAIEGCLLLPPSINYPLNENESMPDKDDPLLITAGEKGVLKIWNLNTTKCIYEQKNPLKGTGYDYLIKHKRQDEEEPTFIAVTGEQNILITTFRELKPSKVIIGYIDELIDVQHVDEKRIIVASNSNTLKMFTMPGFYCDIFGEDDQDGFQHKDTIMSISVSNDKKYVISGSKDNTLIVWDIETKKSVCKLIGHVGSVTAVKFFNNSNFVISVSKDMTWKIWDISESFKKSNEPFEIKTSFLTSKAHQKEINCVSIARNDKYFATGSQDKTIKLYKINNLVQRDYKEIGTLSGHKRGIWDIDFSPVDQVLASTSADQTIKMWSIKDLNCIKTFEGHTSSVLKVKFITLGMQLISTGSDSLIKIWNIHNNECVHTMDKHTDKIWGLSVFNDGQYVVTGGSDSMICVWEDNTEREMELAREKREKEILAEQNLNNFIRSRDYVKAISLALFLDKPEKLYQIFDEIQKKDDRDAILDEVTSIMDSKNIEKFFLHIREWNTNSKHSLVAQMVLHLILSRFSHESLLKLPRIKEHLQSLLPYTDKHLKRIDRLLQRSYIIDYTLQSMQLIQKIDESITTDQTSKENEKKPEKERKKRRKKRKRTISDEEMNEVKKMKA